jgi:hypothetical protein
MSPQVHPGVTITGEQHTTSTELRLGTVRAIDLINPTPGGAQGGRGASTIPPVVPDDLRGEAHGQDLHLVQAEDIAHLQPAHPDRRILVALAEIHHLGDRPTRVAR